jgi:hypothetical protein
MAAGGTPANVKLGPGRLYYAPLGTAEPTNCSSALPSAWRTLGYTENGTEIAAAVSAEDIMVAEELEPIDNVQVSRTITLTTEMAESTKRRLLLALGAGAASNDDSTPFEFPDPATVVGVMLVWDELDTPTAANRRWLFRSAKPSGTITTVRRKAPAKATIAATFNCVKPDATNGAVRVFPNASGQV